MYGQKSQSQGLLNEVLAVVIAVNFTVISSEQILLDLNCMMVNMWLITVHCAERREFVYRREQ